MRQLAKAILYLVFGLVLLFCVIFGIFAYKPGLLINSNNLRRIIWVAAPTETTVHWQQLRLDAAAPRFLVHEYLLVGKDICVNEPRLKGCFPLVSIKARINYRRWPHITESIGPVLVNGDKLVLSLSTEKKKKESSIDWEKIYEHASKIEWQPIVLKLNHLTIHGSKKPIELTQMKLALNRKEEHIWNAGGQLGSAKGFPVRKFSFDSTVDLHPNQQNFWQRFVATARAETIKGEKLALNARVQRISQQDDFSFNLHGLGTRKESTLDLDTRGTWRHGDFEAVVSGTALRAHPQLPRIDASRCTAKGRLPINSKERTFLDVNCPLSAKHNVSLPPSVKVDEWPDVLSMVVKGNVDFPHGRNRELNADVSLKTLPLSSPFVKLAADTAAHIRRSGRGHDIEVVKWDINLDAKILRFSKLVKALENSPWAIPAPIRSFQGEIGCKAGGGFDVRNKILDVPIQCNTDLISTRQEFLSKGSALFRMQKRPAGWQPTLDANIQIQRGQLEVPEIDWRRSLPQLFTDKRITQGITSTSTSIKPKFHYTVVLNTTKGSPIKLLSNLARDPVPMELKELQFSSRKPLSGTVIFHQFHLQPLKQLVSLNKFVITYPGSGNPALLDGLFDIYNVDYTIKLAVVGTMAKPRIEIFSDPPRPQTELLSAVIFGDATELDSDQMRSVEEARAAIADGAISLISMYYLAATPIDSIGYNPYTGVVRAKIRLSGRTSLTIGSDLRSQQSIGLRRRLSPNWSLETTVQHNTESDEQSERAMLRWAKRY